MAGEECNHSWLPFDRGSIEDIRAGSRPRTTTRRAAQNDARNQKAIEVQPVMASHGLTTDLCSSLAMQTSGRSPSPR